MLDVFNVHIPKLTIGTMMAVNYLALGSIWRRMELHINLHIAFTLLLLLFAIVYFTNVQSITAVDGGMLVNSFPHAIVYTALSLIGILGVWGLMRTAQSFNASSG